MKTQLLVLEPVRRLVLVLDHDIPIRLLRTGEDAPEDLAVLLVAGRESPSEAVLPGVPHVPGNVAEGHAFPSCKHPSRGWP